MADDLLKNEFKFTLEDKSSANNIQYFPASNEKVEGTELIVDVVTFIKRDLKMICKVNYHYVGDELAWKKSKTILSVKDTYADENLKNIRGDR